MYWSGDADHCDLVANSISRDRFDLILRFLHIADNSTLNKDDKLATLCTLMDYLNVKFATTYPMEQQLNIGESMIEYFGKHGCK